MPTYEVIRRELTLNVSYDAFVAAFEGLLGRMDLQALTDIKDGTQDAARERLAAYVGPLEFALFQKIDHGGLRTAVARKTTLAMTYVFGNALIAIEMTKHDPRAGLYVPLRLFVHETSANQVLVTYDLPSSLMKQFGSPAIDEVAASLDQKVQRLLDETLKRASQQV